MFTNFVYMLQDYGIPVSMTYVIDFYKGLEKGLVETLDDLFLFARLNFVKKVEHMDAFERAFAMYFFGVDIPAIAEGDMGLFQTKQFREWLQQAIQRGELPAQPWNLSYDELMKRFWDTVREQMEAHNGGNRWVGTGGTSPFGNSGAAQPGVRAFGGGQNRSAVKVIGERNYIDYSASNTLSGENIRQALSLLKNIIPAGPESELDVGETVYKTSRNGGEIELIFKKELRDKIRVILLIDNGGTSMMPWVDVTRMLFSKFRDRIKELKTYYFHNTVYGTVYSDPQRYKAIPTKKLLEENPETRVIFMGDASMAPEELVSRYGSIYFDAGDDSEASYAWLQRIRKRFKYSVWLNPIPSYEWDITYGSWTLQKIREVIHMEDLTLRGIKKAVEYLNSQ
ncbi:MAG: hypothetical protein HQM12_09820 [SAR324 cluster bacterium]|nr:hypothetical protein [SAR324 cluster bacterium]